MVTGSSENAEFGWWTASDVKSKWWAHRDQKASFDEKRDAVQFSRFGAAAFAQTPCYQSSFYMTDCEAATTDSLLVAVGSHLWPDDCEGWAVDGARHTVSVPSSDEKTKQALRKLRIKAGELVVWDSRVVHFGGVLRGKRPRQVSEKQEEPWKVRLWRPPTRSHSDIADIKADLEKTGVALVQGIASQEECDGIESLFAEEMAEAFGVAKTEAMGWRQLPKGVWTKETRGGGGWGVASCTASAMQARLLPNRVALFKRLLEEDDLVVSIDSVHWSPSNNRLCFMASFAPRRLRDAAALKRKCVALASGRLRTTHHAALGDISRHSCASGRFHKMQNLSASWRSPAASGHVLPPQLTEASPLSFHSVAVGVAASITLEEAQNLVKPEYLQWL